jgi:hypothetical protein
LDFVWYRDTKVIAGQVNSTYTQSPTDVGHVISVKITAVKAGYSSSSYKLKAPVTVSVTSPVSTSLPTMTGTLETDHTVTAHSGTWSMTGLTFGYQWTINGSAIPGATKSTYIVRASDVLNHLAVTVTASKKYLTPGIATSDSQVVQPATYFDPTTSATIPTTADYDTTLTLTTQPTWKTAYSLSYQWFVQDAASSSGISVITGATDKTFTPTASDGFLPGDKFMLFVYVQRPGYTSSSVNTNFSVLN